MHWARWVQFNINDDLETLTRQNYNSLLNHFSQSDFCNVITTCTSTFYVYGENNLTKLWTISLNWLLKLNIFANKWSCTCTVSNIMVLSAFKMSWMRMKLTWMTLCKWDKKNTTVSFVLMQLCEAKFNTVLERILWGYTFQFCLHWTQTNNKTSLADISKLTQKRLLDKCDDFGHSCANCYHPWTHWGDW